ncbi:hypothetical protein PWR63_25805 [Paraburkholderia sp. A2WS-5]|uniref:hypothetical protein n=1 Tax=unclassified Paraburkholderia TaxID=2615204 RepID=UPI003B77D670
MKAIGLVEYVLGYCDNAATMWRQFRCGGIAVSFRKTGRDRARPAARALARGAAIYFASEQAGPANTEFF